jgi:hypothetical protein
MTKGNPTKRAADGGDSAAFSGFFYAPAESCSRSFVHAHPTAANANRWAAHRSVRLGDCLLRSKRAEEMLSTARLAILFSA